MKRKNLVFLLGLLALMSACAQQSEENYNGEWVGHLSNRQSFNFHVSLTQAEGDRYRLRIMNDTDLIDTVVGSTKPGQLHFDIDEQLFFKLDYTADKTALDGFIQSGKFLYRVHFPKNTAHSYSGKWNAFMVDDGLQSDDIMLYVELMGDLGLVAFPFFGDQRFRGMWTWNFERDGNLLRFTDGNGGLNFVADLQGDRIKLGIYLTDRLLTKVDLTHTNDGWEYRSDADPIPQDTRTPKAMEDGWATGHCVDFGVDPIPLNRMIDSISEGVLVNTHSVLIAKKDTLVFENYYGGWNARIPHDLRSASKSISSAVIGIALEEGILPSVETPVYDLLPQSYQYTKAGRKARITLQHLLTMSSGLEVNGEANEDRYQDPRTPNGWLQTVLEAPMVHEPGDFLDYGSANPFLLGVALAKQLDLPLQDYMHEKLFAPLGIVNYINQTDDTYQDPYFGGGMLLTSRDLLKFGQLFLNKGKWNDRQVLSEAWVAESFSIYGRLQDTRDKNEYGYLWWHDRYTVGKREIKTVEARGAGGQFIFIIPELESVVVITSGNFRNRKGNQPRTILKEYILPAMLAP